MILDKSYSSVVISATVPIKIPLGKTPPSPLVYTKSEIDTFSVLLMPSTSR